MSKYIICSGCKRHVKANPRLKGNQKYCGSIECQRERKRRWYSNKITTDHSYAAKQKESKQKWRKEKPSHQYQKRYREEHPEYQEKNRLKQRERNKERKLSEEEIKREKIVKIDALFSTDSKTKSYAMKILTPGIPEKIVKIDTLIVQLQEIEGLRAIEGKEFLQL